MNLPGIIRKLIGKDDPEMAEKLSDRPWVKIVSEGIDPEKGIKIELDWNDAFIKHLRENNITGTSDEQVIQKYLALLLKSVVAREADQSKSQFE